MVERVLEQARESGFLGDASIAAQVAHAEGFAAALESAGVITPPRGFLDLGSGGGIPGLVLAARWPETPAVLLDANEKRSAALTRAVDACGWTARVQVVHDRAERAGHLPALRGAFPVVVARSFGPPAVVAECGAAFLELGGLLVVSEPPVRPPDRNPSAHGPGSSPATPDPVRWPDAPLATVGLQPLHHHRGAAGYQVLRQVEVCPARFPRRVGVPSKRPLYR